MGDKSGTGRRVLLNQVTIDDAIELLNDALATDMAGMSALVNARVRCSADLASHPVIQVSQREGNVTKGEPPIVYQVGLLGVINGLFGIDERGHGPIAAICEDGLVVSFQRRRE